MANKNRKCKWCKEFKPAEDGVKVPAGWFCSMPHALEFVRDKQLKASKKAAKQKEVKAKQRKKDFYDNDRSHQLKLTQTVFNRWIRFRDEGKSCISCGRDSGCKVNAGHYLSVGARPELRFNPLNNNLQCEACNVYKSGNVGEYKKGLINKIGLELVEWLEGKHEPKKYTCEQLREVRSYYNRLIREGIKTDSDRPFKD